jgi:carboxylesterase
LAGYFGAATAYYLSTICKDFDPLYTINELQTEPYNGMMDLVQAFQSEEHQPFAWSAGPAQALFVHGFPGTPAELRPLASLLHQAGWSVQGLLLPGHGIEIESLFERHQAEWVQAVELAITRLPQQAAPVLLIGYSLGGALALQAAVTQRPTALILLAPFWQLGDWWQQWLGFLLKPFLRHMRPFQKADFSKPQVRHGIAKFFPGANLDDPLVQQNLRQLTIPTSIFERLHAVGQAAYRVAPQAALPTLVVQGAQDEVVSPQRTRRLVKRLAGPTYYQEIPSGHNMIYPNDPGWLDLTRIVLDFAQEVIRAK